MENYTGSTSDHDGSEASYDMGATAGIQTGPDGYDGVGAGATMIVSAGSTAEVVQGEYGNAGVGVTAQAGYSFHGSDHVSDHGAGANVGGFVGDCATVSVDGDVKYAGVNAHVRSALTLCCGCSPIACGRTLWEWRSVWEIVGGNPEFWRQGNPKFQTHPYQ